MKCLVSELKAKVNKELPLFNKLVLHITAKDNPGSGNCFLLAAGCHAEIKNVVSGVGCFYTGTPSNYNTDNNVKEIDYPSGTTKVFYISNGEFDVVITNKYGCEKFVTNTPEPVSLSSFEFMTNLTRELAVTDGAGNLISDKNTIEALGKLTKLQVLSLRNNKAIGEITTLAASQVANGRTSGTLAITSGGHITLNGTTVQYNTVKTIKFGSSMVEPTAAETTQGYQVV